MEKICRRTMAPRSVCVFRGSLGIRTSSILPEFRSSIHLRTWGTAMGPQHPASDIHGMPESEPSPYLRHGAIIMLLIVSAILAQTVVPAKNIAWSTWSNQLFDKASREHKFVLLSLESQWCQDCQDMQEDVYADDTVRALIEKNYIPVKVDSSARPDLANRYSDYALPIVVIFDSDGSEIVRKDGYVYPRQMASLLRAVIVDPSPGPSVKPEPTIQYSSSPAMTPAVLRELEKSYASSYDIPAQDWAFEVQYLDTEFVEYGLARSEVGGHIGDRYLRLAI